MSKTIENLELEIERIERDLDKNGYSKWLEIDRNALLNDLRERLKMEGENK